MIEMKCPFCEAEGRVPSDKVQTRLVCRKCLKVFHLTLKGVAVPGEPVDSGSQAHRQAHHDPDLAQEADQFFAKLTRFGIRAGVILGVVILGTLLYWATRPVPLQERATMAANALVGNDLETIRSLALSGTGDDAVKWFDTIRNECEDLRRDQKNQVLTVNVDVRSQDESQGTAEVVAELSINDEVARRGIALPDASINAAVKQTVRLPLFWTSRGWKGWQLDGKRTLEARMATVQSLPTGRTRS